MDRTCNRCGNDEWTHLFETGYPERRRERDQTVKTVYVCTGCGGEGKHFEHKDGGTEVVSGAFR